MIEQNIRFTRVMGRGMHFGRAGDEPSHIHIPRPSRLLRRDAAVAMVEVTPAELREISAVADHGPIATYHQPDLAAGRSE